MNKNPFDDPSVVRMSSPTPPPPLDPSHLAQPSQSAPPMGAAPPYAQPMGAHQNLMDEIGNSIKATNSTTILRVMRTVNLLLAAATVTAGLLAWIMGHVTSPQKFIAGVYIIMFGALLMLFEMRTEKIDLVLRANFGFMYGHRTRTAFLVFIAIWPLSMGNFWLTILDAVLLFANAFFNYYVISQHPGFSQNPTVYDVNEVRVVGGSDSQGYADHRGGYVPTQQI